MSQKNRPLSEKLLPGFTVPRALCIVAGAAIVSFGLYNVHRQSGITEGGVLGTVLGCLLTGVTASTYCLSLSLLLAFAMLYPEVQLLLFFVIPIRVKYFGVFAAVLWVFSFLGASLPGKLDYLLSMLNVWLFFAPMAYRSLRAWVRREQWKRKNRR